MSTALILAAILSQHPPTPQDVEHLVSALASPTYQVRTEASESLLQVGFPAVPALRSALDSESLEQQVRASAILWRIEQEAFKTRARRFATTGQLPADMSFPAWGHFHQEIGDDAAARELYWFMVEAESALMWQLDQDPRLVAGLIESRCAELAIYEGLQTNTYGLCHAPSVGTVCALLYASAMDGVNITASTAGCLNNMALATEIVAMLASSHHSDVLRRLLGHWLANCENVSLMSRLSLAARFSLPEGVDTALQMIEERPSSRQVQYAVFYLAKMGGIEHVAILEDLLDDDTELDCRRYSTDETFYTKMQDVALVAVLHLTGQDPAEYGFEKLRENDHYLYQPDTAGFATEDARWAALQKWFQWRTTHLGEVLPAPEKAEAGISL